jgi:hypothetical protein
MTSPMAADNDQLLLNIIRWLSSVAECSELAGERQATGAEIACP